MVISIRIGLRKGELKRILQRLQVAYRFGYAHYKCARGSAFDQKNSGFVVRV